MCDIRLSASSVLRILAEHPIKPWQYQSWIYPRDPHFAAKPPSSSTFTRASTKASRSAGRPHHVRLCQAAHPGPRPPLPQPVRPPPASRCASSTNTSAEAPSPCSPPWTCAHRHGARRCHPEDPGIAPFMTLMGQVMNQEPYKSAPCVFVIVDNGSGHRGKKAARRLRAAYPNAIVIHTPVHASWLNQRSSSPSSRKVVSSNDFTGTGRLAATLTAFIDRYNQAARPFNWKFTAADLARFLDRISGHEEPASLPEAA